ncbi:hypothetical protein PG993_005679 [Apiospora rasikravindrae]|uniref:Asparaginase n=1 Tax=Apiospora rasikravindrae TaxID=990691 RepID=A0ABR1TG90_9PEZI
MGLRRVKNSILLVQKMLENGEDDLTGKSDLGWSPNRDDGDGINLDIPSAQGHTLILGPSAEILAEKYGLELVEPGYFFTQTHWNEHVRALEREEKSCIHFATWSPDEYPTGHPRTFPRTYGKPMNPKLLENPQRAYKIHPRRPRYGFLTSIINHQGAVALDSDGVLCCATSTGGMTKKLTGRIGDTPSVGAGFWAEEWSEQVGDSRSPTARTTAMSISDYAPLGWKHMAWPGRAISDLRTSLLNGRFLDCLPGQPQYSPLSGEQATATKTVTRSVALLGAGNGDSFLRLAAAYAVAAIPATEALRRVAGRGGALQKSADNRWSKTGEGEGGMIGIESTREEAKTEEGGRGSGSTVVSSKILQDFNCGGMFRAWIDDDGSHRMKIWDHISNEQDFIRKHAEPPGSEKGQEGVG